MGPTTRYECPLRTCTWSHTETLPEFPEGLEGLIRTVFLGHDPLQETMKTIETTIRTHVQTHSAEEFLREIEALRFELAKAKRTADAGSAGEE